MLRFGEALMALAPLAAAALLWAIIYRRVPGRRAIAGLTVAVVCLAGALVWQGIYGTMAPHERYVPAALHDGQVIEGHGG